MAISIMSDLATKVTPRLAQLHEVMDPAWLALLQACGGDFYHRTAYLEITGRHEGGNLCIAHSTTTQDSLGVPLLLRPVPEDLLPNEQPPLLDAASPYGYPCPLTNAGSARGIADHWHAVIARLRACNVVSLFLRLHPLLTSQTETDVLRSFGEVVEHGETVWLDLQQDEDEAWSSIRKNHRRDISRLTREGWRFTVESFTAPNGFPTLYRRAMERLGAQDFYFFDESYFADLSAISREGVYLATVVSPNGDVGAQALFFVSGTILQYHLGATSPEHLHHAPMKLLFDQVRRWARGRGMRHMHLGGGVGGKADSLFHFKAGFSPLRATARTFRCIVHDQRYAQLNISWQQRHNGDGENDDNYFPPYRRPLAHRVDRAATAVPGRGTPPADQV